MQHWWRCHDNGDDSTDIRLAVRGGSVQKEVTGGINDLVCFSGDGDTREL